jgi:hypothetical protein
MKPKSKKTTQNNPARTGKNSCPEPSITRKRVSPDFFFVTIAGIGLILTFLLVQGAKAIPQNTSELSVKMPTRVERNVRKMTHGFPIEKMAEYIGRMDRKTAAFLVGVAKKESNWGKRIPKKDGADCFNYWGYRGADENMTESGYTCFDSREEAIATVGGRMSELINEYQLDTPREFVVWKCGYSCAGHAPGSVEKWIADVGIYVRKMEALSSKMD